MNWVALVLGGAGEFVMAHPFVSAWLALTSAWTIFTVAKRDA